MNKFIPGLTLNYLLDALIVVLLATLGMLLIATSPIVAIAMYFVAIKLVEYSIRIEDLERRCRLR